jgi:hypothetical protein
MTLIKSVERRFLAMRWIAQQNEVPFEFTSYGQALHYLVENGEGRPCAYCGRIPEQNKVGILDCLNPKLGYVPGNLVPCCSSHHESLTLSCYVSRRGYSLLAWMERAMSRARGSVVPFRVVEQRLDRVYALASKLGSFDPEKETPNGSGIR